MLCPWMMILNSDTPLGALCWSLCWLFI
jgi:hypothetical protein